MGLPCTRTVNMGCISVSAALLYQCTDCQWEVHLLVKPVPLHPMAACLQPLGVPYLEGVLQYESGLSVIGKSSWLVGVGVP